MRRDITADLSAPEVPVTFTIIVRFRCAACGSRSGRLRRHADGLTWRVGERVLVWEPGALARMRELDEADAVAFDALPDDDLLVDAGDDSRAIPPPTRATMEHDLPLCDPRQPDRCGLGWHHAAHGWSAGRCPYLSCRHERRLSQDALRQTLVRFDRTGKVATITV